MAGSSKLQDYLVDVVTGRRKGISVIPVLFVLSCLEYLYLTLLWVHRAKTKAQTLPVPVISVGNVLVGGTGKTPTVVSIARLLIKAGYHPAVLTRGYGSRSEDHGLIFKYDDLDRLDPEVTGDEPNLLVRLVPQLVIGVGRDRYTIGCRVLAENPEVDVFILDDGFQYWGLNRDLDIVLLDALNPFGNGHLLPRGLLREPLAALKRAGLIFITRVEQIEERSKAEIFALIARYNKKAPIAALVTQNSELTPLAGATERLTSLDQVKVGVITAIGNPDQFRNAVARNGADIQYFRSYPDHHLWTEAEINLVLTELHDKAVNVLVVTAKDGVKLSRFDAAFTRAEVGCYLLQLDFIIPEPAAAAIKRVVSARKVI